MKEVLTYLLQTKTSPISWLSIAKNTSINSSHTAQSYVELLRDIYLVSISHYIDPNGRIHYRKNKKIHFFDPFLIKILTEYTRTEMLEEHIVESLISGHFSRKYDSYYWRGSTEVDIITQIDSEIYGFEVKWGPIDWKKPRFLRKSYLLTKEVIPSFLASLDWNGGQL